jgi:S1-C subfamily serine protease
MTRQQRQVEVRQDPNGARVEVRTRTGNGPEEVKVYEGRTLDEIYQAHPELEAENALKDQLAPPSRMPMVPDRRVLQPMQQRSVLGVMCQPKDGGLQIEEVVDGSIAAQVGLRAGDVLLELNGTPVPSREEVARVLQDRRPGEDLVIVIQDANGKRRTLTHRSNY